MPVSIRNLTVTVAASAAAVLSLAAGPAALAAGPAAHDAIDQPAAAATAAGLTGTPFTLVNNAEFSGYDAATDASGKSYIGWIGDTGSGRKVPLCTLPRGARHLRGRHPDHRLAR